jgi:hypothetical protein
MGIQEKLLAWGKGLAMQTAPNGYPPRSPYVADMRTSGRAMVRIAPLPDDEQQRIDGIVSGMKQTRPERYEVICLAYITRLRDHQIAQRIRASRHAAKEIRIAAEAYLEAKLE